MGLFLHGMANQRVSDWTIQRFGDSATLPDWQSCMVGLLSSSPTVGHSGVPPGKWTQR